MEDELDTANAHIAEGLIWASLCAAVLKRLLAHAAQRVGGTAMSTRRVAMCAHHISPHWSPRDSSASGFAGPSAGLAH